MVSPQRQLRTAPGPEKPRLRKAPARKVRRSGRVQRRRFVVLVLVPVLLMLGSVYLHTVAANLGEEALLLEEKYAGLLSEKERLQVEVSKLSAPDRIRSLARENLGMRSPGAEDMRVYDREDGKQDEGQPVQEDAR